MDIMAFLQLMGSSDIPMIAAFFIGLMTAISPCPLATNITAIAVTSKNMKDRRKTVLVGLLYTAGRAFTYVAIALLIVWIGISTQSISLFLQRYGERLLGPFLLALGLLMVAAPKLPSIRGGHRIEQLKQNLAKRGLLGGFLLGVIFALAFCPFSAVLFFGMLIPLSLAAADPLFIPAVFAFGTGLPVILISIIIAHSLNKMGSVMNKMNTIDLWLRRVVSLIFIIVGVYYTAIFYAFG